MPRSKKDHEQCNAERELRRKDKFEAEIGDDLNDDQKAELTRLQDKVEVRREYDKKWHSDKRKFKLESLKPMAY